MSMASLWAKSLNKLSFLSASQSPRVRLKTTPLLCMRTISTWFIRQKLRTTLIARQRFFMATSGLRRPSTIMQAQTGQRRRIKSGCRARWKMLTSSATLFRTLVTNLSAVVIATIAILATLMRCHASPSWTITSASSKSWTLTMWKGSKSSKSTTIGRSKTLTRTQSGKSTRRRSRIVRRWALSSAAWTQRTRGSDALYSPPTRWARAGSELMRTRWTWCRCRSLWCQGSARLEKWTNKRLMMMKYTESQRSGLTLPKLIDLSWKFM